MVCMCITWKNIVIKFCYRTFSFIIFTDFTSNRNTHNATVNFDSSTEVNQNQITPEPISKETFLMSQSDREGQQLYTCYHSITNHITVRKYFSVLSPCKAMSIIFKQFHDYRYMDLIFLLYLYQCIKYLNLVEMFY